MWQPAQIRAYRIADNKTAEASEWDLGLLPLELLGLKEMAFDLDLLGFSADELTELLAPPANEGLTDPDDVPAPPNRSQRYINMARQLNPAIANLMSRRRTSWLPDLEFHWESCV